MVKSWLATTLLLLVAPLGARAQQPAPEPPLVITPAPPVQDQVATPPTEAQRRSLLKRIEDARKALGALTGTPSVTRQALSAEIERLGELLGGRAACNPTREVKRLEGDLALAAAGETPHLRPGLHRLAYRSPIDRRLHQFVVYVPEVQDGRQRLPLVVMLHGMNSTPMRAVGRLFGVDDEKLGDHQLTCDRPSLPKQDALVVAPEAFGDSLYRLAGERDVTTVVQMTMRLYRVDRRRVTITGLSMGGTGAAEIAFQYPQVYAGVLALCGYYDRRLDNRIRGQQLQPWERQLNRVHSPVDWAENGRGIPLALIHGTLDGPERARAMERRYKELGYPVTLKLFDRGHDVWTPGYAGGKAFDILGKLRKPLAPSRVTFASGRPRIRRGYRVVIDAWQDYRRWARVDAEIVDRGNVRVTTENVAELRLDLPAARLARKAPVKLVLDGAALEIPAQRNRWVRRVRLARGPGGWGALEHKPPLTAGKRPGLSGPIEDIYFDPIVVVYGTGGGQAAILRRLAQQIGGVNGRPRKSSGRGHEAEPRYQIVPDRSYRASWARRRSVILVGNEKTNRVLTRLGPSLPIRVLADEVRLGGRSLKRPNIGATFIVPNPDSPRWYLLVVGGTTPESYRRWRQLPGLLPDYVVFDDGVATRRWRIVLGSDRTFVEAGYFDNEWKLPGAAAR